MNIIKSFCLATWRAPPGRSLAPCQKRHAGVWLRWALIYEEARDTWPPAPDVKPWEEKLEVGDRVTDGDSYPYKWPLPPPEERIGNGPGTRVRICVRKARKHRRGHWIPPVMVDVSGQYEPGPVAASSGAAAYREMLEGD